MLFAWSGICVLWNHYWASSPYRQRKASGTRDGRAYRQGLFNYLFSSVGSAFGLWALYWIQEEIGLGEKVEFEQAFVPAAFVVAWAGVIWPKPIPIAVTCLLHEVMPAGGGDPRSRRPQIRLTDLLKGLED